GWPCLTFGTSDALHVAAAEVVDVGLRRLHHRVDTARDLRPHGSVAGLDAPAGRRQLHRSGAGAMLIAVTADLGAPRPGINVGLIATCALPIAAARRVCVFLQPLDALL